MLKSDRLDVTPEDSVGLSQLIERCIQRRNDFLGFIGGDDQFDIDFFVFHPKDLRPLFYAADRRAVRAGGSKMTKEPRLSMLSGRR
jgi:hypothetical protein